MKIVAHALFGSMLFLNVALVRAQNFTNVTGTIGGHVGMAGIVDGIGTNAQFNTPHDVAVDAAGDVFLADEVNHTIRELTLAGTNWVSATIAGRVGAAGSADGAGTNAQFNYPSGVAVDGNGNVFVADEGNHTIRELTKVGLSWQAATIAGLAGNAGSADGSNGAARFNSPSGLAVDASDDVYVADWGNHTIRELIPSGTNWNVRTIAGLAGDKGTANGANSAARFNHPEDVAVDANNDVYVADWGNHAIREMTLAGTNWNVSTIAGVAGSTNYGSADGVGGAARFYYPSGLALDSAGNIYVADTFNDTIREMTLAGGNWTVSTIAGAAGVAGSADGVGVNSRFYNPCGVAVDSSNNVFVADTGNQTIRLLAQSAQTPPSIPPAITAQPQSVTATNGNTVSFTVTASGSTPLFYQWLRDGIAFTDGGNLSGSATNSLTITNVSAANAGVYSVVVSNAYGSVTSSIATLNFFVTLPAGASGLTFDDISDTGGGGTILPSNYAGLNWNNFYYLNALAFANNPSGYRAGLVSPSNVVYNAYGTPAFISSSVPFNFFSGYLTAAWNDNLQVQVLGYNGATLTYSNVYTLNATAPTLINFNYLGITEIYFNSYGGSGHLGYTYGGASATQFAMDNAVVSAASSTVEGPILNPANGHTYYIVSKGSWTNDQAAARALGGNLVTIRSAAENNWIVTNLLVNFSGTGGPNLSNLPLWIGLYDPSQDLSGGSHAGNFVWADGEPVTYTDWNTATGEPTDTGGNEFYGAINWHFAAGSTADHGVWNDTPLNGTTGYGGTSDGPYYGIVEIFTNPPPVFSTTNLLLNPGAETGTLTNWTVGGSSNPKVDNGTFDTGINPHSGGYDFYGGNGTHGSLSQVVSLVGNQGITAAMIDNSNLAAGVSFWEQGLNQSVPVDDDANVTLAFLDASSNVLTTVSTPAIDSHNNTWSNYVNQYAIPSGTRFIQYAMNFYLHDGSDLDGFVDDNYLGVVQPLSAAAAAPTISIQPQSMTVTASNPASFTVAALGSLPLFYQWQKNGINLADGGNISGSRTNTLDLSTTSTSDDGSYAVVITNAYGSVTSSVVNLTVIAGTNNPGTSITWTNVNGGSWNNAANWSPNQVPGPSDTAVANLNVAITIDSPSTVSNLTFIGTLGGGKTLTVNGTMKWNGGDLEGSLTVAQGGMLTISNYLYFAYNNYYYGYTNTAALTNYGTVVWAGTVYGWGNNTANPGGDIIYNAGLWQSVADNSMTVYSGNPTNFFINAGTLQKTGGTGTSTIAWNFSASTGTINTPSGYFSLNFAGTNIFRGTANLSSGGQSGVLTIASNAVVNWSGSGVINGAVNVSSNSVFNWNGGDLEGSLTVAQGGTLAISNYVYFAENNYYYGYTNTAALTNYGTVIWGGYAIYGYGNSTIYNAGLWQAVSDGAISTQYGTNTFINAGTLQKTGGTGTSTIGWNFRNTGVFDTQTGLFAFDVSGITTVQGRLNYSGTINTPLTVVSNAVLNWLGGDLEGSLTVAQGGTLAISNGVIFAQNNYNGYTNTAALTNYGTVVWAGSINANGNSYGGGGGLIDNAGLWESVADNTMSPSYNYTSTNSLFINTGTLEKIGGTGTSTIGWSFASTGTINTPSGTFTLDWNGVSTLHGNLSLASGTVITSLTVASNAVLNLSGGDLEGSLTVAQGGTLAISNTVIFAQNNYSYNYTNTAALTNYGTVIWAGTIYAAGNYYTGGGGGIIDNAGLWESVADNTMSPSYGYTSTDSLFINTGTLQKTGGTGTSTISWNLNNNGGTVTTPSGGYFNMGNWLGGGVVVGNANFSGGTVSGTIAPGAVMNFSSVTVNGSMVVSSNAVANWNGGDLEGSLTVAQGGTLNISNTVYFAQNNYSYNYTNMATLTNYGTVVWAGTIYAAGNYYTGGGGGIIDNAGLWESVADNTMSPSYGYTSTDSLFINTGTLQKAGGTRTSTISWNFASTGTINTPSGTFALNWNGVSTLHGNLTLASGTVITSLTVASNAVLNLSGGDLEGSLTVAQGGTLAISNTVIFAQNNYSYNYTNTAALTNYGTVVWAGTIYAAGNYYTGGGGGIIDNAGLWESVADNSMGFYGYTSTSSFFINTGTLEKVGGTGTTTVNWNFNTTGTVDIQSGIISVNNGFNFSGGSTLDIAIGGTNQGTGFGQLQVNGSVVLAGTLNVTFANGFVPVVPNTFSFLTASGVSGGFASFFYPSNVAGLQLSGTATSAVLSAINLLGGTTITWVSGVVGNWNTATNWYPNQVPGPTDTAIINSGTATVSTNTTVGTLNLGNSSVLNGAATLTINNVLNWNGGTMSGAGRTVIPNGAVANLNSGPYYLIVDTRTVENEGTMVWNGGTLSFLLENGGVLTNGAPGMLQVQNNGTFSNNGGSGNRVDNAGTFQSSGAGTMTFNSGLPFNNYGTVQVQNGTLTLIGGGTNTGGCTLSSGTTLNLNGGTSAFTSGSTINGPGAYLTVSGATANLGGLVNVTGTNTVSGGTANITGNYIETNGVLNITGGTANFNGVNALTPSVLNLNNSSVMGGTNMVTVGSVLNWNGGTMSGAGRTVIPNGAVANLNSGPYYLIVDTRTVENEGTMVWNGGTLSFLLENGGVLTNGAPGMLQVQNNGTFSNNGGSGNRVDNAGTFQSSGAGTTTFNSGLPFNNYGTVQVQNGTLTLIGGGTNTGGCTLSSGTTLNLNGGTFAFTSGSTINGPGAYLTVSGATANLGGLVNVTGTNTVSGGTANITGNYIETNGVLNITGGTANFNGVNALTPSVLNLNNSSVMGGTNMVTVGSVLNWNGGTMSGAGRTVIPNGAVANLNSGPYYLIVDTRTVENEGTMVWNGGTLSFLLENGGVLTNGAPGMLQVQNNGTFSNNGGSGNRVDNAGTFQSSGAGTTTFNSGLPFNNYGTVQVQNGTLTLIGGGTNTGGCTLSSGTTLNLNGGTFAFTSGSTINGPGAYLTVSGATANLGGLVNVTGTNTVSGGTANITGNYIETNGVLNITGGTANFNGVNALTPSVLNLNNSSVMGGTNMVTVGSVLNWNGGTMSGAGRTVIPNGAVANLNSGPYYLIVDTRTVENEGTMVWNGGTLSFLLENGGVLTNGAPGMLQVQNNGTFSNNGGSGNRVDNAGTFQSSGTGTTTFNSGLPFNNYGTVQVQNGTLSIASSFVQTAGLTLLEGGNLSVSQPFQLLGGTLAGTNTIFGSVTNNGTVSPGASLGILTISGNYIQTTNGTLQIELAGASPGTGFDQLIVSNTAIINGTLNVTLTNGFQPALSNTFTVLSAGSLTGNYASFVYPSSTVGISLTNTATSSILLVTNMTHGNVALSPQPVLSPNVSGGNFNLSFQSVSGHSYTLYYNNNLATTNWLPYTNVSGNGGTLQLTVPVTNSAQRFFRISEP